MFRWVTTLQNKKIQMLLVPEQVQVALPLPVDHRLLPVKPLLVVVEVVLTPNRSNWFSAATQQSVNLA